MQQSFEQRIYAQRPIKKNSQWKKSLTYDSKYENVSPKSRTPKKMNQTRTSFLLNDTSTLGNSEITFSDFENGLEQQNIWNEITSILNDSCSECEHRLENKTHIKRPLNPFYKNFQDDD